MTMCPQMKYKIISEKTWFIIRAFRIVWHKALWALYDPQLLSVAECPFKVCVLYVDVYFAGF